MAVPGHPRHAEHRRVRRVATALGRACQAVAAIAVLGGLCGGLPWALVRCVGWPLPDHVPNLDELTAVLMTPMSTRFLLDALACLAWLIWFFFVLDVAGCLLDIMRGAQVSDLVAQSGPLRRVAAALVAALLVTFLSRTAIAAPIASGGAPEGHAGLVASAAQHPAAAAVVSADPAGTVRVRPPRDGVHDSLYRVAERCLGDGSRWPEIWALNQGSSQPSGRILTKPSLVHPGDLLRLPPPPAERPAAAVTTPRAVPPEPERGGSTPPRAAPASPVPDTTDPSHAAAPSAPTEPVGGVSWGPEVFVSLGLAAAISAVFVALRRRHHARYKPGSGRRDDDLPVAPVVYQLHLAHLHAQHHDEDTELIAETHHRTTVNRDRDLAAGICSPGEAASVQVLPRRRTLGQAAPGSNKPTSNRTALAPEIALATAAGAPRADSGHRLAPVGTIALDLARAHGLGLVGPGSYAAGRALLLTILTTTPATTVVVPATDLTRLLGVPVRANARPDAIHVVDDITAALAALESNDGTASAHGPQVLVTSPPAGDDAAYARLQALLDTGDRTRTTGLILGQWRPGVTAYVTAAGTISATDPGLGEELRGTRAFTLPDTAARDLLAVLRAASPAGTVEDSDPRTTKEQPELPTAGVGQVRTSGDSRLPSSPRLEILSTPPADPTAGASRAELFDPAAHGSPVTAAEAGQATPLVLSVFGAPALAWRPDPASPDRLREISGGFSRRLTELLVFLAVHPGGVSRDAIVDALWAEHTPRDPASVLRTVVSRIRRAVDLATGGSVSEIVLAERGQLHLTPDLVEVDYWAFSTGVIRRRAATTDHARATAYEAIVAAYGGVLAEGLVADWLTAAREATRRDALDAVAALARVRVHDDPDATLDLLETARTFDPHNELIYRDIMRLEHTLGRHDAISRTLTLLETRLGEIDATPMPATVDLAARLRDLHTGITTPAPLT